MLRIIRRTPWIALGAAAVYYLDAASGPGRRRASVDALLALADTRSSRRVRPDDERLLPSIAGARVRSRAAALQAEEIAAGITDPAPRAMAARILEESEWRVVDRDGSSGERRRSEDTVEVQSLP